jgi:hypothetical protein
LAEFLFTREFIEQLAAIEKVAPEVELRRLEAALASIAANPERSDRFLTHYDPGDPSYFVRRDPFLIRYSVETPSGRVVFRTLFRRAR